MRGWEENEWIIELKYNRGLWIPIVITRKCYVLHLIKPKQVIVHYSCRDSHLMRAASPLQQCSTVDCFTAVHWILGEVSLSQLQLNSENIRFVVRSNLAMWNSKITALFMRDFKGCYCRRRCSLSSPSAFSRTSSSASCSLNLSSWI